MAKTAFSTPPKRLATRRVGMLAASMLLAVLSASGVALAATIDCSGGVCVGTNSKDTLYGSPKAEVQFGLGGRDNLVGRAGSDVIYGGPGSDGGFFGGRGDDIIRTGPGDDSFLTGDDGNDIIYGGEGAEEEMYGGRGADVLYGGPGSDLLWTKWEDRQPDKLYCGKGKDTYFASKNDFVSSSCEKKLQFGPGIQ